MQKATINILAQKSPTFCYPIFFLTGGSLPTTLGDKLWVFDKLLVHMTVILK